MKSIKISGMSEKKVFMINGTLFIKDSNEVFDIYRRGKLLCKQKKLASWKKSDFQKKILHAGTLLHLNNASFIQSNNHLYTLTLGSDSIPVCTLLTEDEIKSPVQISFHEVYHFYYVSTYVNGIYMLFPKQFKVQYSKNDPQKNSFFVQVEMDDSSLYTPHRRIEKNGEILPLTMVDSVGEWGLYHDNHGNIWGGTKSSIFKFNYKSQKLDKYIINEFVKCFEPEGDTLWFSTENKIGYILHDAVVFIADFKSKLSINHIKKIKNTIYISASPGFYSYDITNKSLIAVNGLAEKTVFNACLLQDGSMFLALPNDNPYYYYYKKAYALPLDKEGRLAITYYGIPDKRGFIWVPTSKGLFQVKKNDIDNYVTGRSAHLYYFYYDKKNGFNSNEFNGGSCNPCGLVKRNGDFSLSSLNGLIWFNPDSVAPVLPYASMRIDHIEVDSLVLDTISEIKIQHGFSRLLFEVSVPYFGHSDNLIIEYSLEGSTNEWYPVATDGKILFTSLPTGDYSLKIRKIDGFGLHNYSYINYSFVVLPPWYLTIVSKTLFCFFLLLLIYVGYRIRFRKLVTEQKKLDGLVNSKTKELNNMVSKLQQTVQELKISEDLLYESNQQKDKLTTILAHDLKSPLRFMAKISDYIFKNIGTVPHEKIKTISLDLKNASQTMSAFTEEFLIWLQSQKENYKVKSQNINLKELVAEMYEFYADIVKMNNNELIIKIETTKDFFIVSDQQLLKVILRNLIDNANKNTQNGKIIISVEESNGCVLLAVKDTGDGMNEEQVEKLLNVSNPPAFSIEIKEQFGFVIIKDFILKLGGKIISVKSELLKGTEIKIRFPIDINR